MITAQQGDLLHQRQTDGEADSVANFLWDFEILRGPFLLGGFGPGMTRGDESDELFRHQATGRLEDDATGLVKCREEEWTPSRLE